MPAYAETFDVKVSDVTQQRTRVVEHLSPDVTATELVNGLLDEMGFPRHDGRGNSISYRALHRREARHLRPNERIGDRVRPNDLLVIQPNVDAG